MLTSIHDITGELPQVEGIRSKLLFFFGAYLPKLAADPNKKYVVLTLARKNISAYQISV